MGDLYILTDLDLHKGSSGGRRHRILQQRQERRMDIVLPVDWLQILLG